MYKIQAVYIIICRYIMPKGMKRYPPGKFMYFSQAEVEELELLNPKRPFSWNVKRLLGLTPVFKTDKLGDVRVGDVFIWENNKASLLLPFPFNFFKPGTRFVVKDSRPSTIEFLAGDMPIFIDPKSFDKLYNFCMFTRERKKKKDLTSDVG